MRLNKTLPLAALLAAGTVVVAPRTADAAFTFTFIEQGGNVVGSGSGSLNLAGTTQVAPYTSTLGVVRPETGALAVAGSGNTYIATGPTSFGTGSISFPSLSSGTSFAVLGTVDRFGVALDYVSGDTFSNSLIFNSATFASLGMTPGTYTWTWGTGQTADSLTIQIGAAAIPEPASMALLGAGLLGLGAALRRRHAA